jgi:CheY-like chemotaxis protein
LLRIVANAALQIFEHHRAEIALLLTDMTMPGIDGVETGQARSPDRSATAYSSCQLTQAAQASLTSFPSCPSPSLWPTY